MSYKILVVDDETDLELLVRQHFRRKIRAAEMEFVFAHSGKEALQKLAEEANIDMVLSDINMPEMDGLTLLREMIPKYPLIKPVIVSAYGDMDNVRTAMNNGAFDFVTKPIDFNDLEVTINKTLNEVNRQREAEKTKEKFLAFSKEMQIGQNIQRSFLPKDHPVIDGWDFSFRYYPAKEVGGDYYDAFKIGDSENIALAVGDVSGKGIGAALFMTLFRSLICAFIDTQSGMGLGLQQAIKKLNSYLLSNHEEANMFSTLFLGILETSTGRLTYINGGQEPPAIIKDGQIVKRLEPTGPVVGIFEDAEFSLEEITIEPESWLVAFTDGAVDALNPNEEFFREDKLFPVITQNHSTTEEKIEAAKNALFDYISTALQFDDITMIIAQRK